MSAQSLPIRILSNQARQLLDKISMPAEDEFCLNTLLDGGQLCLHQTLRLATSHRHELKPANGGPRQRESARWNQLDCSGWVAWQKCSSLSREALEASDVETVWLDPGEIATAPRNDRLAYPIFCAAWIRSPAQPSPQSREALRPIAHPRSATRRRLRSDVAGGRREQTCCLAAPSGSACPSSMTSSGPKIRKSIVAPASLNVPRGLRRVKKLEFGWPLAH